jgi:hypothetical protein
VLSCVVSLQAYNNVNDIPVFDPGFSFQPVECDTDCNWPWSDVKTKNVTVDNIPFDDGSTGSIWISVKFCTKKCNDRTEFQIVGFVYYKPKTLYKTAQPILTCMNQTEWTQRIILEFLKNNTAGANYMNETIGGYVAECWATEIFEDPSTGTTGGELDPVDFSNLQIPPTAVGSFIGSDLSTEINDFISNYAVLLPNGNYGVCELMKSKACEDCQECCHTEYDIDGNSLGGNDFDVEGISSTSISTGTQHCDGIVTVSLKQNTVTDCVYNCDALNITWGTAVISSKLVLYENGNTMRLSPNPVSGVLNLDLNTMNEVDAQIVISSVNGTVVYSKTVSLIKGGNQFSIDLSKFATGTYLCKVLSDNQEVFMQEKFLKK